MMMLLTMLMMAIDYPRAVVAKQLCHRCLHQVGPLRGESLLDLLPSIVAPKMEINLGGKNTLFLPQQGSWVMRTKAVH
jgi:hypothetical protein